MHWAYCSGGVGGSAFSRGGCTAETRLSLRGTISLPVYFWFFFFYFYFFLCFFSFGMCMSGKTVGEGGNVRKKWGRKKLRSRGQVNGEESDRDKEV